MSHPNRPDHPDFWKLAAIIQDYDSAAEDGIALERLVSPVVDMESLLYMAEQRGLRMKPATSGEAIKLAATWLDGFVVGARYRQTNNGGE